MRLKTKNNLSNILWRKTNRPNWKLYAIPIRQRKRFWENAQSRGFHPNRKDGNHHQAARLPMSFYLAASDRKDCQLAIKTEGARIKVKAYLKSNIGFEFLAKFAATQAAHMRFGMQEVTQSRQPFCVPSHHVSHRHVPETADRAVAISKLRDFHMRRTLPARAENSALSNICYIRTSDGRPSSGIERGKGKLLSSLSHQLNASGRRV